MVIWNKWRLKMVTTMFDADMNYRGPSWRSDEGSKWLSEEDARKLAEQDAQARSCRSIGVGLSSYPNRLEVTDE